MEDIETLGSGGTLGHVDYMSGVVQHAIQAALGAQQCSGQKLAEALKVSGGGASVSAVPPHSTDINTVRAPGLFPPHDVVSG